MDIYDIILTHMRIYPEHRNSWKLLPDNEILNNKTYHMKYGNLWEPLKIYKNYFFFFKREKA